MDNGETVAQGDNDLLNARVLFDPVIKGEDAVCLGITLCFGIHHLSCPQRVVGDDETAWVQVLHHQVIVFDILALVGIDEHEVVTLAQCGDNVTRIADVEPYALAIRGKCQVFADEVFLLVIDFDGIDAAVVIRGRIMRVSILRRRPCRCPEHMCQ